MKNRAYDNNTGFTLIEILIVVAIIGIIATVAVPSYVENVNKSKRGEAKALMSTMAQQLERCFTQFNSYANAGCGIQNNESRSTDSGAHEVTVSVTATTYNLIATPQFTDGRCGNLSINNTGARTSSNNAYCW